jgi:hypothetical protein
MTEFRVLYSPRKVNNMNVLFEKEMKPILEYVKIKYGDNFIKLYENGDTQSSDI